MLARLCRCPWALRGHGPQPGRLHRASHPRRVASRRASRVTCHTSRVVRMRGGKHGSFARVPVRVAPMSQPVRAKSKAWLAGTSCGSPCPPPGRSAASSGPSRRGHRRPRPRGRGGRDNPVNIQMRTFSASPILRFPPEPPPSKAWERRVRGGAGDDCTEGNERCEACVTNAITIMFTARVVHVAFMSHASGERLSSERSATQRSNQRERSAEPAAPRREPTGGD